MAFVHGKNAYFELDNAAGSSVDLTAYVNDITFPKEVSADETTVFGLADKTYIVGLGDSKLSISGLLDPTLDTHLAAVVAAMKAQASATFIFGPQGSTSGQIKYTGEAIVTSYEVSEKVSEVVGWKADLQVTGAVTRTTF
jgi:hypothetical protein